MNDAPTQKTLPRAALPARLNLRLPSPPKSI